MNTVNKPLNKKALKKCEDSKGVFRCRLLVELNDIIGTDIDAFNDMIEDRVIGEDGVYLTDIGYAVVGHRPPESTELSTTNGEVLIEVTAVLDWTTDDSEDETDDK